MSIRALVTRGFGAGGAIRLIVVRGFGAETSGAAALIELRASVSIVPALQLATIDLVPALAASAEVMPALQLDTLDLAPALAAAAEVTPALRGSIVIH